MSLVGKNTDHEEGSPEQNLKRKKTEKLHAFLACWVINFNWSDQKQTFFFLDLAFCRVFVAVTGMRFFLSLMNELMEGK